MKLYSQPTALEKPIIGNLIRSQRFRRYLARERAQIYFSTQIFLHLLKIILSFCISKLLHALNLSASTDAWEYFSSG